ncbi:MAG: peptide ABC transporter substrate-binding protein, partial [Chloroflexota bacterium]|nr:peptide ABC transporter substrate-binding protein [Chloroflexota bacterium]
ETPVGTPGETPAGTPGETPTGTEPVASPTEGGQVQPGGTIIIGEWQTPATVHPYLSNAWVTQQAAMPVLSPLIMIDDQGQWFPYLLAELPTAEEAEDGEGFTITMRVKDGLVWSDGEPLNATDIAYTYQWAVDMAEADIGCGGCGGTALRLPDDSDYYVTDVAVADDEMSVTFTWQQKYAGWLPWAAMTPLPEQYFGDIPPDQVSGSMPLSSVLADIPASGPFVFVDAGSGSIDYARNENFNAFPQANLDNLRRQYFGDKNGMIAAFLTGDVDQISNMTQIDYDAIRDVSPDIGHAELIPAWQYEHLDINNGAGLTEDRDYPPGFVRPQEMGLDDVNVRQAIHAAIDKEDLWNTLFPGHPYTEACSNAPPSTWWYDPSITCTPFDPTEADRLLTEAGWTSTDGGPRTNAEGTVMRLILCTTSGNPTRLTTLGKINEYLLNVGIQSDIRTASAADVVFADYPDVTDTTECALSRGNYHISLFTYLLSDPGGLYYSLFHSANVPPGGDNGNWTRIANDELDTLLENALQAISQENILASLGEVQQAIVDLKPEIPLYYRGETSGVSRHLGNFKANPSLFGPVWNVHEWYFIE